MLRWRRQPDSFDSLGRTEIAKVGHRDPINYRLSMHDNMMTAALGEDGAIHFIDQVPNGKACGCRCTVCKQPLIARQGAERQWSFAHYPEHDASRCAWAAETALHRAAKEVLATIKCLHLPKHPLEFTAVGRGDRRVTMRDDLEAQTVTVVDVALEQWVNPIKPDVVVTSSDGTRYLLEITVTHGIDRPKREKIEEMGIATLELDLRQWPRQINRKALTDMLLGNEPVATWVFHPRTRPTLQRMEREARQRISQQEQAEEAERLQARKNRQEREENDRRLSAQVDFEETWGAEQSRASVPSDARQPPGVNPEVFQTAMIHRPRGLNAICYFMKGDGYIWVSIQDRMQLYIAPSEHPPAIAEWLERRLGPPNAEGTAWRLPFEERLNWFPFLGSRAIAVVN